MVTVSTLLIDRRLFQHVLPIKGQLRQRFTFSCKDVSADEWTRPSEVLAYQIRSTLHEGVRACGILVMWVSMNRPFPVAWQG